jgi:hypothetical protein
VHAFARITVEGPHNDDEISRDVVQWADAVFPLLVPSSLQSPEIATDQPRDVLGSNPVGLRTEDLYSRVRGHRA